MPALISSRPVAVAFCCDPIMATPLHVAMSTLFRNLSQKTTPHFYVYVTDFTTKMKENLRRTLDSQQKPYLLSFLEKYDEKIFTSFRSLLGNYTTYYRLLLPDLIEEPIFLYVDTDTLPQIDVAPLFEADMGQYATGFVVDGKVGTALESRFFQSLGMDPDGPAFNAGVMLVQRQQWEEQDCWNRILRFCQQYPNELLSADQTVLNALMATNCFHIPDAYNVKVYPRPDSVVGSAPALYHFVGSPKPWDMLARTMLPYSKIWFQALDQTPLSRYEKALWLHRPYWQRFTAILGGYRRLIKAKMNDSRSK